MAIQEEEIIEIMDYPIYCVDIMPVMEAKGIPKNPLCRMTGITYNALQRCCKSEIKRADLDVISRVCKVLECDISETIIKDED